jgi:hypothetical protein
MSLPGKFCKELNRDNGIADTNNTKKRIEKR